MSKNPIAVIGDVILDEYWYGVSERISPEAPVPVVLKKQSQSKLGGASNVALNVVSLEEDPYLIGLIGLDEAGGKLKALLVENNIKFNLIEKENLPTIQKLRILANNHYIGRVDFEEEFKTSSEELLSTLPSGVQYCILSDYGKGTLSTELNPEDETKLKELIQNLKAQSCKVLVDPKSKFSNYQGSWLIKPNRKEFQTYVGKFSDFNDLKAKAQRCLAENQIENMLITLGADGMVLVTPEDMKVWPSRALEVFDVTGAGDTVIATLASFMAKGLNLEEAIEMANKAAAIAVSKKGVYNVKLSELLPL